MKKAFIILFILPAALALYLETTRTDYKEPVLKSPGKSYPLLVEEEWMGIYFKGKKLGFSYNALFKGNNGFKSTSRTVVRLSSPDSVQETSFNNETILSNEKELLSFSFVQEMSGHKQVIEGVKTSEKILMEITSSGAVSKKDVPFTDGSVTGSTLIYKIMDNGLIPGKKYPADLFIEPLQTVVRLNISIIGFENISIQGRTIRACKIQEEFDNIKAYVWITEKGRLVREVSPEGLVSVMEPREKAAFFSERPLSVNSFINFSLVRTEKSIERQDELEQIRIRVTGLSEPGLIPEDGRQWIEEHHTDGAGFEAVTLTINRGYVRKLPSTPLKTEYLSPTPEIQSDYPEIVARASEITGKEKDNHKKARLILAWVFNYMKKKPVDTFTAADALHSGEGECQSHTNLFAALARASKIPVRVASGLVYSVKDKGFLYHAWPEVYVGRWIAMDPTFGQERADPTHIKLSEGGWDKQLNLLKFIGKIGVEVVETS